MTTSSRLLPRSQRDRLPTRVARRFIPLAHNTALGAGVHGAAHFNEPLEKRSHRGLRRPRADAIETPPAPTVLLEHISSIAWSYRQRYG
jgi:hypothetical protein